MNRIAEKRARLLSLSNDEQARILINLVGRFGALAETRPHHPAVQAFSQALDEAAVVVSRSGTALARHRAAEHVRAMVVEGIECVALAEAIGDHVARGECVLCGNEGGDLVRGVSLPCPMCGKERGA